MILLLCAKSGHCFSAEMLCSMTTLDNLNSHLVPERLERDLWSYF